MCFYVILHICFMLVYDPLLFLNDLKSSIIVKGLAIPPEETSTKAHSGMYIKSPMVGTVYLAPEPGGKKFVEIGKKIKKGDNFSLTIFVLFQT